jgi:Zn-dependent peptidase ImmA (M78 family)
MPPDVESIPSHDGAPEAEGLYNTSTNEISIITKDKTEDQLKALLLHEVLHAVFGTSGIWQHLQGLDDNLEELICANLESLLAPLIEFREDSMVPYKEPKKRAPRKKK